jgi:hypothetical protein
MNGLIKNLLGWKTKRKIVVIESDDWGSIRMSSNDAIAKLKSLGADIDKSRYDTFETIESNSDMEAMFESLMKFKDVNGKHPVITGVNVVANPDFEKIKESGYKQYYYEPFTETLKKYPEHDKVYQYWKYGIENRLMVPQFHGREHLNVNRWMRALQSGSKGELAAFDLGVTGLGPHIYKDFKAEYQGAFELELLSDLESQKEVLISGTKLFQELFGYQATAFTPTNGPFSSTLEPVLKDCGINLIQTARMVYKEPIGSGKYKRKFRYMGMKNSLGQRYLLRNCVFEPNEDLGFDWFDFCMPKIEQSFKFNNPVIITTHRVNYSGMLKPENRNKSLAELERLLKGIITKWPDVEFMTTAELGLLMNNKL